VEIVETETITTEQEHMEPGRWEPRGDSGLSRLWVIPVSRGPDGRYQTFRCEGERGAVFNMSRAVLEAYYRPGGSDGV
jgi:hypothetical protein